MIIYYHPSALLHDAGRGHPESPVRIRHVLAALEQSPLDQIERREPRKATHAEIERVHPAPYPSHILDNVPDEGYVALDADTTLSPGTGEAALHAAGAACAGVDAIMAGDTERAFSLMRPPGHHAEPARPMGFCLFNSVAIGAMQARHHHQIGKIAIVDFDVHHGNGTQAAFWRDPKTMYVSIHQWPLYPGTGAAHETGAHDTILICPMPPGTGSKPWRDKVINEVIPALEAFEPEFLFMSAGFDAHQADPLANFELNDSDFAWITKELVTIAEKYAKGRVVSVLEGGYNPEALARSVLAHLEALDDAN